MMVLLLNHDTVVYSYNTQTKQIAILSDTLRKRLDNGIAIPQNRLQDFSGHKIVQLAEAELFHKAFKEIFFSALDKSIFRWEVKALTDPI